MTFKRGTSLVLAAGASLVALWSATASAQDTQGEGAQGDRNDIVVTALRRETSIQKTPLSISAISEKEITRMGATGVSDYFREIPNMQVEGSSPTARRITIRGIRASGAPTVGLYYDESPLAGPNGTSQDSATTNPDINLFDVQRVEVLRGPQGTLYGSGSMGGTVRVIFNKADTHKYEGAVEGQIASTYDGGISYYTKGMINAPIIKDLLALRVVGYNEKHAGWVDDVKLGQNDINAYRSYGGRAMLTFTPAQWAKIYASATIQESRQNGQEIVYPALGRHDYVTNASAIGRNTDNLNLYNVTGKFDLGFGDLTVTSSHYTWDLVRSQDNTPALAASRTNATSCSNYIGISGTCSPAQLATYTAYADSRSPGLTYQPQHISSWNHEARLSGTVFNKFLDYTVGIYRESLKDKTDSAAVRADVSTGRIIQPFDVTGWRVITDNQTQTAFFGEVTAHPTSRLSLTAGTRHFDYNKIVAGQVLVSNYVSQSYAGAPSQANASAKGWVGKFAANYEFTPHVMAYVSASKGFRPGGANNVPGLGNDLVSFQPDTLWDYEAGIKSQWFDNLLTVNLTAYRIDWSNLQVSSRTAIGSFVFIANAGAARVRGGEGEVVLRPLKGLNLRAGLGFTDAYLTQNQANSSIVISNSTGLAGDHLPNIPRFNGNLGADYTFPLSGSLDGVLRADVTHVSSSASQFRPNYVYYDVQPAYETVNLRAGVESNEWSAYVFVNNLTNSIGNIYVSAVAGVVGAMNSITPRTVGLTARRTF